MSTFSQTVTFENVQRFVDNHDIFARYKHDELVALGHMSQFYIDEEDQFIHDAYLTRRRLLASSYAYKRDAFEFDVSYLVSQSIILGPEPIYVF